MYRKLFFRDRERETKSKINNSIENYFLREKGDRASERGRARDRDRQADRHADRQADRERDREKAKQLSPVFKLYSTLIFHATLIPRAVLTRVSFIT